MKLYMRVSALCAVLLLMCGVFAACGDSRVGTYQLHSMVSEGEEIDSATLEMIGMADMTLVLASDKTCTMTVATETVSGTWDDTTVTLAGVICQASWDGELLILTSAEGVMRFSKTE